MVDKDKAMQEWLEQYPAASPELNPLLFDWLTENQGDCAIVPISGQRDQRSYISGSAQRRYDFSLRISFMGSETTDSVNTDNMYSARQWQEWIEKQEFAENYPDFGDKCSCYELTNNTNTPERMRYENGFTVYSFYATLYYLEER